MGREFQPGLRSHSGFKALPNAEAIKSRIEEWVEAHVNRAAAEVGDFVRESPQALNDWNVVREQGPADATVEMHSDEIPEPTSTYENTMRTRSHILGRMAPCKVVAPDGPC